MITIKRLIDKSNEAFVLAIEIYNKPTIRYRLEGFSFFICNAWELMLKAYLIKKYGHNSIYYSDKNNRTISLENCIQKVFTNENTPLRKNLLRIIELRNTSTHFITEEYEMVYVPLLQSCVFNFIEKMNEFHGVDITQVIPENFITLTTRFTAIDETVIKAKYTTPISEKLLNMEMIISKEVKENNSRFSIKIEHQHYLTKNKNEATDILAIDKTGDKKALIIKQMQDPSKTHKYNTKNCVKEINKRIKNRNICLLNNGKEIEFNSYHFGLFCKYFSLKDKNEYCYKHHIYTQPSYTYSIKVIDFILDEIAKNPEGIIKDLKEKVKKLTPGAKDSKQ